MTTSSANIDRPGRGSESPDADLAAVAATAPIEGGLADYFRTYLQRIRGGDMGSLPAVAGLIVLVIVFWSLHPTSARWATSPTCSSRPRRPSSSRWAWSSSCCSARSTWPPAPRPASARPSWPGSRSATTGPGRSRSAPRSSPAWSSASAPAGCAPRSASRPSSSPWPCSWPSRASRCSSCSTAAGAHGNISITDNFITDLYNGQMDAVARLGAGRGRDRRLRAGQAAAGAARRRQRRPDRRADRAGRGQGDRAGRGRCSSRCTCSTRTGRQPAAAS